MVIPTSDSHPSPEPTSPSSSQPEPPLPSSDPKPVEWMAAGNDGIVIDYNEKADGESIWSDASRISLASSINHYRLENDRKYHTYRDGAYWAPHDEQQLKLDNYAHLLWLLTLNDKLYLAPLDQPEYALDIGTGIGIWAQNFADLFPETDVLGTDLIRIQQDFPAPNLRFDIDDCVDDWVVPPNHYNYIHIRMLYGSIPDWPKLYQECYEHLAPGGWIEHGEINPATQSDDGTLVKGDIFDEAGNLATSVGYISGKRFDIQPHIRQWIEDAGFVDVVEQRYKWPIGDWPLDPRLKEMGILNARHWIEGIEGWTMRVLTEHHKWSPERVRKWCHDMRIAIQSRRHHVYQPVTYVYARKPL